MIAIDTNILVYAHRADSPFHEKASKCVGEVAEGDQPWGIAWPCVHEFLAIVTHTRIYNPPTPLPLALDQVAAWLESPTLVMLGESTGYFATLKATAEKGQVTGPRIHDARIAALCASHGVRELYSADRDFNRFAIRVRNPLVA